MFDTSTRTKVDKFLRRMLYGDLNNVPDRITLVTLTAIKKMGTELHVIYFPKKSQTSGEEIEGWISEIEQIAYDDCEDLGGVQKYALLPYHGKQQRNRLTFRMAGEEKDDDSFDSEPATKSGMIAHLMRHNEAYMRQLVGATNTIIIQQSKTIGTLASQNEALQAKHVEGMVLVEELLTQRHERTMEDKRVDFQLGIKQDAYNDFRPLVPIIANKLLGKKVLPETLDATTQAMKSLMESLRPEQIQRLASGLTPPQQIAFLEFYEMFRQDEQEQEGQQPEGQQPEGNGVDSQTE